MLLGLNLTPSNIVTLIPLITWFDISFFCFGFGGAGICLWLFSAAKSTFPAKFTGDAKNSACGGSFCPPLVCCHSSTHSGVKKSVLAGLRRKACKYIVNPSLGIVLFSSEELNNNAHPFFKTILNSIDFSEGIKYIQTKSANFDRWIFDNHQVIIENLGSWLADFVEENSNLGGPGPLGVRFDTDPTFTVDDLMGVYHSQIMEDVISTWEQILLPDIIFLALCLKILILYLFFVGVFFCFRLVSVCWRELFKKTYDSPFNDKSFFSYVVDIFYLAFRPIIFLFEFRRSGYFEPSVSRDESETFSEVNESPEVGAALGYDYGGAREEPLHDFHIGDLDYTDFFLIHQDDGAGAVEKNQLITGFSGLYLHFLNNSMGFHKEDLHIFSENLLTYQQMGHKADMLVEQNLEATYTELAEYGTHVPPDNFDEDTIAEITQIGEEYEADITEPVREEEALLGEWYRIRQAMYLDMSIPHLQDVSDEFFDRWLSITRDDTYLDYLFASNKTLYSSQFISPEFFPSEFKDNPGSFFSRDFGSDLATDELLDYEEWYGEKDIGIMTEEWVEVVEGHGFDVEESILDLEGAWDEGLLYSSVLDNSTLFKGSTKAYFQYPGHARGSIILFLITIWIFTEGWLGLPTSRAIFYSSSGGIYYSRHFLDRFEFKMSFKDWAWSYWENIIFNWPSFSLVRLNDDSWFKFQLKVTPMFIKKQKSFGLSNYVVYLQKTSVQTDDILSLPRVRSNLQKILGPDFELFLETYYTNKYREVMQRGEVLEKDRQTLHRLTQRELKLHRARRRLARSLETGGQRRFDKRHLKDRYKIYPTSELEEKSRNRHAFLTQTVGIPHKQTDIYQLINREQSADAYQRLIRVHTMSLRHPIVMSLLDKHFWRSFKNRNLDKNYLNYEAWTDIRTTYYRQFVEPFLTRSGVFNMLHYPVTAYCYSSFFNPRYIQAMRYLSPFLAAAEARAEGFVHLKRRRNKRRMTNIKQHRDWFNYADEIVDETDDIIADWWEDIRKDEYHRLGKNVLRNRTDYLTKRTHRNRRKKKARIFTHWGYISNAKLYKHYYFERNNRQKRYSVSMWPYYPFISTNLFTWKPFKFRLAWPSYNYRKFQRFRYNLAAFEEDRVARRAFPRFFRQAFRDLIDYRSPDDLKHDFIRRKKFFKSLRKRNFASSYYNGSKFGRPTNPLTVPIKVTANRFYYPFDLDYGGWVTKSNVFSNLVESYVRHTLLGETPNTVFSSMFWRDLRKRFYFSSLKRFNAEFLHPFLCDYVYFKIPDTLGKFAYLPVNSKPLYEFKYHAGRRKPDNNVAWDSFLDPWDCGFWKSDWEYRMVPVGFDKGFGYYGNLWSYRQHYYPNYWAEHYVKDWSRLRDKQINRTFIPRWPSMSRLYFALVYDIDLQIDTELPVAHDRVSIPLPVYRGKIEKTPTVADGVYLSGGTGNNPAFMNFTKNYINKQPMSFYPLPENLPRYLYELYAKDSFLLPYLYTNRGAQQLILLRAKFLELTNPFEESFCDLSDDSQYNYFNLILDEKRPPTVLMEKFLQGPYANLDERISDEQLQDLFTEIDTLLNYYKQREKALRFVNEYTSTKKILAASGAGGLQDKSYRTDEELLAKYHEIRSKYVDKEGNYIYNNDHFNHLHAIVKQALNTVLLEQVGFVYELHDLRLITALEGRLFAPAIRFSAEIFPYSEVLDLSGNVHVDENTIARIYRLLKRNKFPKVVYPSAGKETKPILFTIHAFRNVIKRGDFQNAFYMNLNEADTIDCVANYIRRELDIMLSQPLVMSRKQTVEEFARDRQYVRKFLLTSGRFREARELDRKTKRRHRGKYERAVRFKRRHPYKVFPRFLHEDPVLQKLAPHSNLGPVTGKLRDPANPLRPKSDDVEWYTVPFMDDFQTPYEEEIADGLDGDSQDELDETELDEDISALDIDDVDWGTTDRYDWVGTGRNKFNNLVDFEKRWGVAEPWYKNMGDGTVTGNFLSNWSEGNWTDERYLGSDVDLRTRYNFILHSLVVLANTIQVYEGEDSPVESYLGRSGDEFEWIPGQELGSKLNFLTNRRRAPRTPRKRHQDRFSFSKLRGDKKDGLTIQKLGSVRDFDRYLRKRRVRQRRSQKKRSRKFLRSINKHIDFMEKHIWSLKLMVKNRRYVALSKKQGFENIVTDGVKVIEDWEDKLNDIKRRRWEITKPLIDKYYVARNQELGSLLEVAKRRLDLRKQTKYGPHHPNVKLWENRLEKLELLKKYYIKEDIREDYIRYARFKDQDLTSNYQDADFLYNYSRYFNDNFFTELSSTGIVKDSKFKLKYSLVLSMQNYFYRVAVKPAALILYYGDLIQNGPRRFMLSLVDRYYTKFVDPKVHSYIQEALKHHSILRNRDARFFGDSYNYFYKFRKLRRGTLGTANRRDRPGGWNSRLKDSINRVEFSDSDSDSTLRQHFRLTKFFLKEGGLSSIFAFNRPVSVLHYSSSKPKVYNEELLNYYCNDYTMARLKLREEAYLRPEFPDTAIGLERVERDIQKHKLTYQENVKLDMERMFAHSLDECKVLTNYHPFTNWVPELDERLHNLQSQFFMLNSKNVSKRLYDDNFILRKTRRRGGKKLFFGSSKRARRVRHFRRRKSRARHKNLKLPSAEHPFFYHTYYYPYKPMAKLFSQPNWANSSGVEGKRAMLARSFFNTRRQELWYRFFKQTPRDRALDPLLDSKISAYSGHQRYGSLGIVDHQKLPASLFRLHRKKTTRFKKKRRRFMKLKGRELFWRERKDRRTYLRKGYRTRKSWGRKDKKRSKNPKLLYNLATYKKWLGYYRILLKAKYSFIAPDMYYANERRHRLHWHFINWLPKPIPRKKKKDIEKLYEHLERRLLNNLSHPLRIPAGHILTDTFGHPRRKFRFAYKLPTYLKLNRTAYYDPRVRFWHWYIQTDSPTVQSTFYQYRPVPFDYKVKNFRSTAPEKSLTTESPTNLINISSGAEFIGDANTRRSEKNFFFKHLYNFKPYVSEDVLRFFTRLRTIVTIDLILDLQNATYKYEILPDGGVKFSETKFSAPWSEYYKDMEVGPSAYEKFGSSSSNYFFYPDYFSNQLTFENFFIFNVESSSFFITNTSFVILGLSIYLFYRLVLLFYFSLSNFFYYKF